MNVLLVTGSGGLVGSTTCRELSPAYDLVVGIDNDQRARFFGDDASTRWAVERLTTELPNYVHVDADIRDAAAIESIFAEYGSDIRLVIHTAAQPSHDWAAREPLTDFDVNARGTMVVLEATRAHCPDAVFIFTSTNKVYGDTPNRLPLVELDSRWEIAEDHQYRDGIDETMSLDHNTHSLFGVSKVAADLLVQEYGRYFGMRTTALRAGCLTGPAHSGAELHGFLAYLVRCALTRTPYRVFGYKAKQVRDNLHAIDLVNAFTEIAANPRCGEAYNMGGGRFSNCSMLEAIALCEDVAGQPMAWTYEDGARVGDHIWWISSTAKFERDYPNWRPQRTVEHIVKEIATELESRLGLSPSTS